MNKKEEDALFKALESLKPSSVTYQVEEDIVYLNVCSDLFKNLYISKRFSTLSELLEFHAPELVRRYTFIFEAWTKDETAKRCQL